MEVVPVFLGSGGAGGGQGERGASADACTVPSGVIEALNEQRLPTLVNMLKSAHGTVWGDFMLHELYLNRN